MATQGEESSHTAQVVGNAFVERYYSFLSQSPELVHRFYHKYGVISRPEPDGLMTTASTLEGIEKLILSHDYKNCVVEILTKDSQESFGDGVIVLVSGYLTGKDNNRRKFTQMFFLSPQDASRAAFSVLNDVLRYVDEIKINDDDTAPLTPDLEPTSISSDTATDHSLEVDVNTVDEDGKISATDKEASSVSVSTGSIAPDTQSDAPKKSYASVANALNYQTQPFQQRALPPKPPRTNVIAAPEATPPQVSEKSSPDIVKGYSIFVANLPMDATVKQVKEAFQKFGPVRPNGVQVRSYKLENNCFGFVEFESASSRQSAVEASSLKIGERMAHIEEKRDRKSGFRGDSYKSRGNFGEGRGGDSRIELNNQAGLSGQSRGSGRRNDDTNHKVYQNGSARQGQGYSRDSAQARAQAQGEKS